MEEYHIRGGNRICGRIKAAGAKNSALPILAAALLTEEECLIEDCPQISDVDRMKYILRRLGCKVGEEKNGVTVSSSGLSSCLIPEELMKTMRSSVFLAGPLLSKLGQAEMYKPGGCRIGARPIDIHLQVLRALGAEISFEGEKIICRAKSLKGADIELPFPSVGATENAMTAAARAQGVTVIKGAAGEPEILDLQNFLNSCGAHIRGAGTGTITIEGVERLHGAEHKIIPDRIEGGTFLAAAAITGGDLLLENGDFKNMGALLDAFERGGCRIGRGEEGIRLTAPKRLWGIGRLSTGVFPGFPTDMQPQMLAVMALAEGTTLLKEEIFENRFAIVKELNKMGARIEIVGRNAIINGIESLQGRNMMAEDLRGGAALVLAALAASGESHISGIEHINRGYFNFDERLRAVGADIRRI